MEEIVFNTEDSVSRSIPITQNAKCSGYGLYDLLKESGSIIGLEIGCDIGDTSHFLLSKLTELTLHTIDPYTDYVDWNGNNLNSREYVYNYAINRMSSYSDRFSLHRKTSDECADYFEDEYFDFIFIDGLHTYEQLTKDCSNFYSKLKAGGLFSGHDFTAIEGVNRACREFSVLNGKNILTTECDVWYWYK